LNQTDKDAINSAIGRTREAIASDDLSKVKLATEQLEQTSYAMSKAMYESAAASQTANGIIPPTKGAHCKKARC
jgi:hypothetical protein